jgi:hypothetical protein
MLEKWIRGNLSILQLLDSKEIMHLLDVLKRFSDKNRNNKPKKHQARAFSMEGSPEFLFSI